MLSASAGDDPGCRCGGKDVSYGGVVNQRRAGGREIVGRAGGRADGFANN